MSLECVLDGHKAQGEEKNISEKAILVAITQDKAFV